MRVVKIDSLGDKVSLDRLGVPRKAQAARARDWAGSPTFKRAPNNCT